MEGEIGVGKTTFVNYHRYLWEKESKDRLFTHCGEISFSVQWDRQSFLVNVLSYLTTKLYLLYGNILPVNNSLFQELLLLNKVFVEENTQWQLTLGCIGGGISKEKQISIPMVPEAKLYHYFRECILTILKLGYAGIILHFDNLELLQKNIEACQKTFDEIRDILQLPNIYSIFVGKTGFFNHIISPLERVRSIFFGWPIFLKPLSQEDVLKAIHIRYELLASQNMRYIKPIEDEVVLYLYNLYEGKIRFIMDAIYAMITYFPTTFPQTLGLMKAKELLKTMLSEKLQNLLSSRELEILMQMAKMKEFSNAELTKKLGLQRQNTAKYMKKFMELGYIHPINQISKKSIYRVSEDVYFLYSIQESSNFSIVLSPSENFVFLSKRQSKALKTFRIGSSITTRDYAEKCQISPSSALRDLKNLEEKGYLQRYGIKKNTYFLVLKKA
ncbi:MAG: hypothetical protein HUU50_21400 [Candidatus Brocadiae bacterium]|nr:hypothetical protein [Candidatus Brocadiia bacterium]